MCLCVHTRGAWSEHGNIRDYCTRETEASVHHTKMWKLQIVSNRNFLARKSLCVCDYSTVSSRTQVTGCLRVKYLLKNSHNGLTPCSRIFMKVPQLLNESRNSTNLWNPSVHYRAHNSPSLFSVLNQLLNNKEHGNILGKDWNEVYIKQSVHP